jgi:hypothetical protein
MIWLPAGCNAGISELLNQSADAKHKIFNPASIPLQDKRQMDQLSRLFVDLLLQVSELVFVWLQ